jgi:DNA-binding transcriptional ArsR family regulator
MVVSLTNKEPSAFGINPTMARALTDPLRVRILSELSVRPLSPSRFVEEVGGELTKIARYFRQLADWGYIEVIEERPGRRHGAAIEHVYRGIQRVHFDTSMWKTVSHSKRDTVSRSTISAFFARVVEANKAGTFDQEVDRHLSWDGIGLDRHAWIQLGRRLDQVLDWLAELEVASAERLQNAGGEAIPTVVGLMAFRSPNSPKTMLQASGRADGRIEKVGPTFALSPKVAKALSNAYRCRILMEVSAQPLSPSQFVEKNGGSMSHISRCFRELAEWGFIEVFEERKGGRNGGGIERLYRGTHRPYFDTPTWSLLPRIIREEISQSFLDSYFERISEAIEAGTFDAELDRHLSWKRMTLDRPAWAELASTLDEILAWLPELEEQSIRREQGDFDALIPTISGLLSFRAPRA